jgi:hypothetical protein
VKQILSHNHQCSRVQQSVLAVHSARHSTKPLLQPRRPGVPVAASERLSSEVLGLEARQTQLLKLRQLLIRLQRHLLLLPHSQGQQRLQLPQHRTVSSKTIPWIDPAGATRAVMLRQAVARMKG